MLRRQICQCPPVSWLLCKLCVTHFNVYEIDIFTNLETISPGFGRSVFTLIKLCQPDQMFDLPFKVEFTMMFVIQFKLDQPILRISQLKYTVIGLHHLYWIIGPEHCQSDQYYILLFLPPRG